MFDVIDYKLNLLKFNSHLGNPIAKKLIPLSYKKSDIQNLFRIELPCFWRMLYTLKGSKVEIITFIIGIYNHKKYNNIWL